MRVVLGPQTGRPFGRATVLQCDGMGLVHDGAGLCEKRDHLTVAGLRLLFVVRLADEEQWPGPRSRLPACPRAISFAKARRDAEPAVSLDDYLARRK